MDLPVGKSSQKEVWEEKFQHLCMFIFYHLVFQRLLLEISLFEVGVAEAVEQGHLETA